MMKEKMTRSLTGGAAYFSLLVLVLALLSTIGSTQR